MFDQLYFRIGYLCSQVRLGRELRGGRDAGPRAGRVLGRGQDPQEAGGPRAQGQTDGARRLGKD